MFLKPGFRVAQSNTILGPFSFVVVLAMLLAVFVTLDHAQGVNFTSFDADKTLRSNARINPSTLAMEMSIPLPSYRGRAGSDLPSSLEYSSKIWSAGRPGQYTTSNNGVVWTALQPKFAEQSASGWQSTLNVPSITPGEGRIIQPYTSDGMGWPDRDSDSPYELFYVRRYMVVMPDGSAHELREDDGIHSYGTTWAPGVPAEETENGTFLAVDGSRLRLELTYANGIAHSILYLPDGSRFTEIPVGAGCGTGTIGYTDRSGNRLVYSCGTKKWADTLGRLLTNPLPTVGSGLAPSTGTYTYQFPSLGTGTLPVQLVWQNLHVQRSDLTYVGRQGCPTGGLPAGSSLFVAWGRIRVCSTYIFDPVVLTELRLPDGSSYRFSYNIYGEIERIDYPTGGYERFEYAQLPPVASAGNFGYDQFNRGVVNRWISSDGTAASEVHWQYAVQREATSLTPGPYHVKTYAPDGTWSEQFLKDQFDKSSSPFGYSDPLLGRPYEERYYKDTSTNQLLRRKLTRWGYTGPLTINSVIAEPEAKRDPRPEKEISIVFEPGSTSALAAMTETVYDTNSDLQYFAAGNVKQTKSYNFKVLSLSAAQTESVDTIASVFSSSDLASVSEADYLYDPNYKARNISGLATETRVTDGNGNVKAKTQLAYDEASYQIASSGTMPTTALGSWADPLTELGSAIGAKRGLLTTVNSYYDLTNSYYITTHAFYDQYGNKVKVRDGRGNDTSSAYDDDYAFAYPTSVTTAAPDASGTYGSSVAFRTTATYDYNTGRTLDVTDPNGLVTKYEYVDALLRPTKVTPTDGTSAVGAETRFEYGIPTSGVYPSTERFVKTRTQIDSTNWKESYAWADGLGRGIKSQLVDANGDIYSLTCYDSMGRVSKTSNPFRGVSNPSCSSITGVDWTSLSYDNLGRPVSTTAPDSTVVSITYGLSTSSPVGTTKTITDQAGRKREGFTDALGRTTRVIEDPDSAAYATDYIFDTLGNLRKTSQGSQYRYFMYDDLSRLIYARQVEQDANSNFSGSSYVDPLTSNNQWSTKYTYDNNSNIATTTDARNITITASYDALNRIYSRDYSDSTPDVTFYYDGKGLASLPSYSKGKTTKVTSSVSENRYLTFDILGHVLTARQMTAGTDYDTAYSYGWSGTLLAETYPSGRQVRNTIDANGDLSLVESKPSGGSFSNRLGSFTRDAAKNVTAAQLGNGRWETYSYNNRQQVTQIGLGTTSSSQDLLKLEYRYGMWNGGTLDTSKNNGSMAEQKITIPTVGSYTGFTATQTYGYDALNRLTSATETISSAQTWKQEFSYDRYGNKNYVTESGHTTTLGGCSTADCNPAISSTTNRITSSGYSYDYAGSITQNSAGERFAYDGENHQISFFDASNIGSTPDATYTYDGDGRRVKKTSSTDSTIFVYDASGVLIEEYSTSTPTSGETAYVYAGSQIISIEASSGGSYITSYITADHLGSTRITTDGDGNVTARKDYGAFGDETTTSQRITGLGYNSPATRKDYTGYEKDAESGLEFAEARYQNSTQGRFTSVDPLTASGSIKNPQTFNRYSYALNSPYKFTDPLGLVAGDAGCSAEYSSCDVEQKDATEAEYEQRLTDNRDAVAANAAIANGDQEAAQAICTNNSNLICEGSTQDGRPLLGDMVPGNTGNDNRYGEGHDGTHVLSPKAGADVVTIDGLEGNVVYWNVQEYDVKLNKKGTEYVTDYSKPLLYTVSILLTGSSNIMVLKDLESVSSAVKKQRQKTMNLNSKVALKSGDLIGRVRGWSGETNAGKVGLHVSFTTRKQYSGFLRVVRNQNDKTGLLKYSVDPCGSSSPARCF